MRNISCEGSVNVKVCHQHAHSLAMTIDLFYSHMGSVRRYLDFVLGSWQGKFCVIFRPTYSDISFSYTYVIVVCHLSV